MERNYSACLQEVFNRGSAPASFLDEMVDWALATSDEIFEPNTRFDIYSKVKSELGPYESTTHRKAVMLEVMRVLALFESGCNWKEGVDTSRLGGDNSENSEAGAWQVSYDARQLDSSLKVLLVSREIWNGIAFQQAMKFNHPLAMEFIARLLRVNTKHNGPLYKGDERLAIRSSLREPKHSIYPWLSRDAVSEFQEFLSV